jgi:hypothetical protein
VLQINHRVKLNYFKSVNFLNGITHILEKSFLRGQVNMENMSDWQKEDMMKRQKAQTDMQVTLKSHIYL